LKQPLPQILTRPVHILIGQQKDRVKRLSIRPFTLLLMTLLVLTGIGLTVSLLFRSSEQVGNHSDKQQQASKLRDKQAALRGKLSETEALLSLRDAQIKSMQQQLQLNKTDMQRMQQRLDLFDQVLAERKITGVHFLRPSAVWKDNHTIAYQLILVKGKNYPRWIIGHLAFTVVDSKGRSIALPANQKERSGFKIEMTEQTFIEGTLGWTPAWHPGSLKVTLINHQGRNKGSINIPITQAVQQNTEQAL